MIAAQDDGKAARSNRRFDGACQLRADSENDRQILRVLHGLRGIGFRHRNGEIAVIENVGDLERFESVT